MMGGGWCVGVGMQVIDGDGLELLVALLRW